MNAINEQNDKFETNNTSIPQYSFPKIVLMFAWPIVWFAFLIYGIAPMLLRSNGSLPTWAVIVISILGNSAEVACALIIFRREGYRLTFSSLRERVHWHWPKGWKLWLAFVGVFIAAFALSMLISPTAESIAKVSSIPDWMPGHPLKEVNSLQDAYPDITFKDNYLFFIVQNFIVVIIFNMFGEELYYRAALQPKMKGVFGHWDWVANGIGFAMKHLYWWWRVPTLIPAGIAFAFIFGPLGSLPLAILSHWIGNMEPVLLYYGILALFGIG
jgi:membrane protease YdiL (CAAX protease family)